MNRADQAPEPTMEELLASIRLIISDASEKGQPREAALQRGYPHEPSQREEAYGALAGDDVFDLTEEFVSPEQQGRYLPAPGPAARGEAKPAPQTRPETRQEGGMPAAGRAAFAAPAGAPPPVSWPASGRRAESAPAPRPDVQRPAAPQGSRPAWSARELASAPPPPPPQAPRRQPSMPPHKPQARNWAEDVQIPVPDRGPVSLIPGAGGKPPAPAPSNPAGESATRKGPDAAAAAPGPDGKQEAAAVAALAGRLARSAVGVMEASELTSAQQVDFERLDAERRADVSEKLADAIEREFYGAWRARAANAA